MIRSPLLAILLLVTLATARGGEAERPLLHPLFTDHLVFPRDVAAPLWGWTEPGKKVTVALAGKTAEATADAQGRWQVKLGPISAGGPHTLTVTGPKSLTVNDVLVGDVWLCSGQSNMEWGMWGVNDSQKEIAASNHPQIRLFQVPKKIAADPQVLTDAHWTECTPETVPGFSAVGLFFARKLNQDLKVPIGLINSSWGGTVAEAWTSAGALKTMDDFKPVVTEFEKSAATLKSGSQDFDQQMAEWWKQNDPGSANGLGWAATDLDGNGWKTMAIPQLIEGAGLPGFDGIVWFRREFDLPASWAGKDVKLNLGPIDDRDTTWVNGSKVGETNDWNQPRSYKVPNKLMKPGRNVIAIRVLDTGGGGGVYGKAEDIKLEADGEQPIALAGEWKYRDSTPLDKCTPAPQRFDNNPNVVTVLSNGMIDPLVPFAIKGAIWYQGESNAGRADQYRVLMPTMITDWRARFQNGDFPFYLVQLANFMDTTTDPVQSGWAELREAQFLTTLRTPGVGQAVIIDIGDAKDIHPKNKQDVGLRLALEALARTYGQKIVHQGPQFREMKVEGNAVRLLFDHVGGGLVQRGDKLAGFAIAGADGKFVHADARIDGDAVVLSGAGVDKPTTARYGWANNPPATLFNKDGLPATPFRTDPPK